MAMTDLLSLSQALVGSIVLYTIYYIYWELTVGKARRRMIIEHACKPPRKLPQIDPIFGLDLFRTNIKASKNHTLLNTTLERFRRNGFDTCQMHAMGNTIIFTINPEILKTVMSLKFKDWSLGDRRKKFFCPLLGNGIFTTDGAAWQHSRDLLRPNFARNLISDLETFERHVDHLVQAIPRDRSTVDLQDLFLRLTMDSATEFLFGESTNCLAPGISTQSSTAFANAFNRSQQSVGFHARHGPFAALVPDPQFKIDTKTCHDFVDHYVRQGLRIRESKDLEKADGRYVFLHELVKQTTDPVQIRSELLNILLAGRDSTASLLSNVWFIIARRPDIWAKLRSEIDGLGGQKPTFAQIKDMKYLRAVLNESLRLHPVVPGNSRQAIVDTIVPQGGGPDGKSPLLIPKGQHVAWSLYTMHRRKDYYGEDADEFKPERWEKLRPGWEYLPFNGGPRICLGQQFALTEASYTTIRLMQEFKSVESRDSEPWTEWLTITCTGLGGAKVALTPSLG